VVRKSSRTYHRVRMVKEASGNRCPECSYVTGLHVDGIILVLPVGQRNLFAVV
jgi:hypothetical protein